jgi:hypothetical protein
MQGRSEEDKLPGCIFPCNAPINVNPEGGGGSGKGWGFDIFTKKMSNATPSGENSWAKFPTPGMKLYS